MNAAMLVLQILMNLPGPAPHPKVASGSGTGTLLIAACEAGENVVVEPGDHLGTANQDGLIKIDVQAQSHDDDPYLLIARGQTIAFNGTVLDRHVLTAVCPN